MKGCFRIMILVLEAAAQVGVACFLTDLQRFCWVTAQTNQIIPRLQNKVHHKCIGFICILRKLVLKLQLSRIFPTKPVSALCGCAVASIYGSLSCPCAAWSAWGCTSSAKGRAEGIMGLQIWVHIFELLGLCLQTSDLMYHF